jgi:hypothetical protein
MKIKVVLATLIYIICLSSCTSIASYSAPPIASPTSSKLTITPASTNMPTPTSTPTITPTRQWYGPTPETLYGFPTPEIMVLPTCGPEGCSLNLTPEPQRQELRFHELYVGKYVLRNWCSNDPKVIRIAPCAVTISSKGMQQVEVWGYGTAWLGAETGADLTGNGIPEIVIVTTTGAASAETGKLVYEAGNTLTMIMQAHGNGTFIDLNEDGTYEYVAPRRIWSSFPAGGNIWINVVHEYQEDQGHYMLATSKFIFSTVQIKERISQNGYTNR